MAPLLGLTALLGIAACRDNVSPSEDGVHAVVTGVADSLAFGDSTQLRMSLSTDDAAQTIVSARSSDTTTVVVSASGVVRAVGVGNVTVTAASSTGRVGAISVRTYLRRYDNGLVFSTIVDSDLGHKVCGVATGAIYCREVPSDTARVSARFTRMPGATNLTFVGVQASFFTVCGLTDVGTIHCWGSNAHGVMGRFGIFSADSAPIQIATSRRFAAMANGGHAQTCAIGTADSVVYCWGHNDGAQLARGTRGDDTLIAPVAGALRARAVTTSDFATCIIDLSDALLCAGGQTHNQRSLGIANLTTNAETLLPVAGGIRFSRVAIADYSLCGLSTSSDVYCWGANRSGSLGNGSLTDEPFGPQRIIATPKFGGVFPLYSGGMCAITSDSETWCWGNDVGRRTGTPRATPYRAFVTPAFREIAGSPYATCGRTANGAVYCW